MALSFESGLIIGAVVGALIYHIYDRMTYEIVKDEPEKK
jgi:hypothetical protein